MEDVELGKAGFMAVPIKSKYHTKITVDQEMRVEMPNLIPRVELCRAQQALIPLVCI